MELLLMETKLSPKQIHLLKLVFKFRFITSVLLSKYLGITYKVLDRRLNYLVSLGYLKKDYKKSYRLLGKGARYYLSYKAMRLLLLDNAINKEGLKLTLSNNRISEPTVDKHIEILSNYQKLKSNLGEEYTLYSKYELWGNEDIISPPPDIYAQYSKTGRNKDNYFIEIITPCQPIVIKKRLEQYLQYFEEQDSDLKLPIIQLIFTDSSTLKRLERLIRYYSSLLEDYGATIRYNN